MYNEVDCAIVLNIHYFFNFFKKKYFNPKLYGISVITLQLSKYLPNQILQAGVKRQQGLGDTPEGICSKNFFNTS